MRVVGDVLAPVGEHLDHDAEPHRRELHRALVPALILPRLVILDGPKQLDSARAHDPDGASLHDAVGGKAFRRVLVSNVSSQNLAQGAARSQPSAHGHVVQPRPCTSLHGSVRGQHIGKPPRHVPVRASMQIELSVGIAGRIHAQTFDRQRIEASEAFGSTRFTDANESQANVSCCKIVGDGRKLFSILGRVEVTELRSENDKASLSLQPREDRGIGTAAGIQNL
mmetsp:Transcript_19607/g.46606  ORF Transcript_19607/g.46606 Transcript_19607/m.46606 type:complete len:225 (-) Transcript_19607:217-891(-)